VLACDGIEIVVDERGVPVSRWDGVTTKTHPVTGEQVPDENARTPLQRYISTRARPTGRGRLHRRQPALHRQQTHARRARRRLRRSAAQCLARRARIRRLRHVLVASRRRTRRAGQGPRFGFITTNSLKQTFNRRVVQAALDRGPASLAFAIPDHPWVDSADGAAVRIAMTVGSAGHGREGC
jgi:hypothetical protein